MAQVEITESDLKDILYADDNLQGEGFGPDLSHLISRIEKALKEEKTKKVLGSPDAWRG